MIFSAIADPKVLARIGDWLTGISDYLRMGIANVLNIADDAYTLELRPYGWNALDPRPPESNASPPREVGLMVLVGAATQEMATEIAKFCNPVLLHYSIDSTQPMPSFAFPFSPAEVELGKQYEFKLNHVVALSNPLQLSRTRFETLGRGVADVEP